VETEEWSLSLLWVAVFLLPGVLDLSYSDNVVLCCVALRRVHVRVRHVRVFVLRLVRWWRAGLW
jgi:hypothetical protein